MSAFTTSPGPLTRLRSLGLSFLLLGALPARAQAPVLTTFSPVRNALAAPRAANVALTFSQPISVATANNVRVFSAQRGGQLNRIGSGVVSGGGTNTLTFDPTTDFRPGETVRVTVPPTVQGTNGQATAGSVHQFTTAVGGTGTGTFVAPAVGAEVSVGPGPRSVVMGDVDGDGDLDLVAAIPDSTVSVRFNDGSGHFSGSVSLRVGVNAVDVVLGDIDGDGDLDLVTATENGTNSLSVRMNTGGGTFSSSTNVPVGGQPAAVMLADIDGDGDIDLLVANHDTDKVSVRVNDGLGNFSGTQDIVLSPRSQTPLAIVVGDMDGDGDLDLLTANYSAGLAIVCFNDGSGVFGIPIKIRVGGQPASLVVGDVDGDGDLDFVVSNATRKVDVQINNGSGVFTSGPSVNVGNVGSNFGIELGDLDADSDLDLVVTGLDSSKVVVLLNDGTGSFSSGTYVSVGNRPLGITLGDVDGDGDLDLLTANFSDNTVSVRLNGGTGPTGTAADAVASPPNVFRAYPTPASADATVHLTNAPANQSLTVLDAVGRRVAILPTDGTGAATLPAHTLAPGLYVVRTLAGRTARLVVE